MMTMRERRNFFNTYTILYNRAEKIKYKIGLYSFFLLYPFCIKYTSDVVQKKIVK